MKVNELRIGNLINYHEEQITVTISTLQGVLLAEGEKDNPYSGIELTPELARRFMFLKTQFSGNNRVIMIDDWYLELEFTGDKIEDGDDAVVLWYGLQGTEPSKPLCYPNYVHQLQNVYHALSGMELVLNPPKH